MEVCKNELLLRDNYIAIIVYTQTFQYTSRDLFYFGVV